MDACRSTEFFSSARFLEVACCLDLKHYGETGNKFPQFLNFSSSYGWLFYRLMSSWLDLYQKLVSGHKADFAVVNIGSMGTDFV